MQRLLLVALVITSLALFAGAAEWTTLPLLALTLAAAVAAPRTTFCFPPSHRLLDAALIAACAIIALQLVPLPIAIRDALSPQAAGIVDALRFDRRVTGASFAPLSVDPRATGYALAAMVIATLTFWSARSAVAVSSVRWMVRAIVLVGGVLAVSALAFRAIDPTRIYGTWLPQAVGARPFGPFVNRNHFAGWMLVAAPIAAGYLLAHLRTHLRDDVLRMRELWKTLTRTWALPVMLSGLAMAAALLATLSRSALLGLAVAAVVMWHLGHSRLAGSGMMRRLVVLTALAALLLLAVVDIDAIAARFAATLADRPVDRVVIWRETLRVIGDFWVAGVGAGAYGTGMLVYQQTQVHMPHQREWVHFNQAHSHYLQVPAEGGVLMAAIAIAGVGALLWAGRRAMRDDRGPIALVRVGAAAGLAGIAAQSIWETSLTIPANAIICAIAAGLLLNPRRTSADHSVFEVNRSSAGAARARQGPARPSASRRRYSGRTGAETGRP
jgi:O-antigen ligase